MTTINKTWANEQVDYNGKLMLQEGEYVKSTWVNNGEIGTANYKPKLISRADLLDRLLCAYRDLARVQETINSMEQLLNGPAFPPKETP